MNDREVDDEDDEGEQLLQIHNKCTRLILSLWCTAFVFLNLYELANLNMPFGYFTHGVNMERCYSFCVHYIYTMYKP